MMQLRFFINQYQDGTFEIETKHMHYAFRDDLNPDNILPEDLAEEISRINEICKADNINPYFVCNY